MPRKFERTAILLVLAASPLWVPALPYGLGRSFRDTFLNGVRPALEAVRFFREGFDRVGSGILEIFSLQEENRILRARLEALAAHEQIYQEMARENARLRSLLEFRSKSGWDTLPAEVIGREMGPWSRGLLLNKGVKDGVREGMAVMTPVGLVGRVGEAGPTSSRVTLLTDPHFRVMGRFPENGVGGLVMGGPTGGCLITYLPLEETFHDGQAVSTAGGRSFAPPAIPIGVVRKVWQDSSEMYQVARIDPVVRLGAVDEVLVVAWRSDRS